MPAESSPNRVTLLAAMLVLATVIAYLPAINAGFIRDDDILLTANPLLNNLHGLKALWLGQGTHDYTPLTLTTFWLEKRVWGDAPTGYHVVNILLHALAAVLLWRGLLTLRIPGAWLAALLFAIHPVNVASVAWIAERKNTLSAVFFFGSALAFFASSRRNELGLYLASIALFLLAGLSKGAVATLPVVLLGGVLWLNRKITARDLWSVVPFFLLAALVSWLTIKFQARSPDFGLVPNDLAYRIARAGFCVWHYLGGIFFPVGLSPLAPPWPLNLRSPLTYLPAALVVAAAGLFFWKRRGWGRPLLFAGGYYLLMLLPVLGFIRMALQQETPAADWWQYLAAPGIMAAVAGGFAVASDRSGKQARRLLMAGLCLVITLLLLQTWRRAAIYQSMESYCRAVLAENPDAWGLQNNLGVVLKEKGQLTEAIAHYRAALRLNPRYVIAYSNLGNALSAAGQFEQAKTAFHSALQLSPAHPEVLANLADCLFRHGEIQDALATDAAAIRADRHNPRRYVQFGLKLAINGQFEQAAVSFRNAIALDPGAVATRVHLARVLLDSGRKEEAARVCDEALPLARKTGNEELVRTLTSLREQCHPF